MAGVVILYFASFSVFGLVEAGVGSITEKFIEVRNFN